MIVKSCPADKIWDYDKNKCISRKDEDWRGMIGDNKLPNRYWLMISSDYYVCKPYKGVNFCEPASEVKGEEVEGKIVAVFNKYKDLSESITS